MKWEKGLLMRDERSFCSKVLLFGEYSVIQDSMALAIPYPLFEGRILFRQHGAKGSVPDPELKAFAEYLRRLSHKNELCCPFDITSFEFDIAQGLAFESTIPQGHGVGSSGALCGGTLPSL